MPLTADAISAVRSGCVLKTKLKAVCICLNVKSSICFLLSTWELKQSTTTTAINGNVTKQKVKILLMV